MVPLTSCPPVSGSACFLSVHCVTCQVLSAGPSPAPALTLFSRLFLEKNKHTAAPVPLCCRKDCETVTKEWQRTDCMSSQCLNVHVAAVTPPVVTLEARSALKQSHCSPVYQQ